MFSLNQVHDALLSTDTVTLADLVVQSHTVMLALEHAADTLVYFQNNLVKLRGLFRYALIPVLMTFIKYHKMG